LRNDKLDANSFFANAAGRGRPPARRNEFGGTLGGPVWLPGIWKGKDRSFFFINLQGFRLRTQPAAVTTTVPTPAFKQGDFSQLNDAQGRRIPLYDPATTRSDGAGGFTRDPFVGNIIPPNRISTVAKNFMNYIPDPNRPGIVNNFLGTAPSPFNLNSSAWKWDHRFNSNHSVAFSWIMFDRDSIAGSGLWALSSLAGALRLA
jgi:hypothetical protein